MPVWRQARSTGQPSNTRSDIPVRVAVVPYTDSQRTDLMGYMKWFDKVVYFQATVI